MITQCWNNGTVVLQYGPTKIRYNICRINPYKYDTNVEDINPKNIYDGVNIWLRVIYFCLTLKLGNKVYNWMIKEKLTLSHIGRAYEVFHKEVVFFTWATPYVTRIGDALRIRVLTILTCLSLKWSYKYIYIVSVWCSYTSNHGSCNTKNNTNS